MLNSVVKLYSTYNAFTALKEDGSIVTWGHNLCGGNHENVANKINYNIKEIYSNNNSFLAIKDDNSMIMWGVTRDD